MLGFRMLGLRMLGWQGAVRRADMAVEHRPSLVGGWGRAMLAVLE